MPSELADHVPCDDSASSSGSSNLGKDSVGVGRVGLLRRDIRHINATISKPTPVVSPNIIPLDSASDRFGGGVHSKR